MSIKSVFEKFSTCGELKSIEPYGNGHINDTYVAITNDGEKEYKYVLQRVNTNVFKKPDILMKNFLEVTEYLRGILQASGKDTSRECLHLVSQKNGERWLTTEDGEYWRMLDFIKSSKCYDKVERHEQFYECALAFGKFQRLLANFPVEKLCETIENFHNTADRYNNLMNAVAADSCGRVAECAAEISFAKERAEFAKLFEMAHAEGRLPMRVTHNDTKLNNILFDEATDKPICVIDLDTVMPGYSINDFGDSIRFGANTAAEDERDLSKVKFDIDLFELYTKGFIEGAGDALSPEELRLLPYAAMMMTFECGMRFLTDYLCGDTYFKIHREGHNLDRARNQFKLVSEMESAFDRMAEIVKKHAGGRI